MQGLTPQFTSRTERWVSCFPLTAAVYASGVSDDAIHRQGDLVSHLAQYGFATTGGFVTPRQGLSLILVCKLSASY
jgi:hypothetical protein